MKGWEEKLSHDVFLRSSLAQELLLLDSSILTKAFRGELVPQDPNDVAETLIDTQTILDVPAPTQTKISSSGKSTASKAPTDRTSGKTRRSAR